MKILVDKSDVAGSVVAPSSKSQTIRGLMCAALTAGESQIVNPLFSDDTEAAVDVLGKIGVQIKRQQGAWLVRGGRFRAPEGDLFCRDSATTLRFMTGICAVVPGRCRLVGGKSLSERPVKSLVEALQKLGVKCLMEGKTTPPVIVEGGPLKGGETELPGNVSSQFISALLLVAPFAEQLVSIKLTTKLTSRSYLLMTLQAMRKFGVSVSTEFDKFLVPRQQYRPAKFVVEGDWSSASYFLGLGALSEKGVEVSNLSSSSIQGDRFILEYLRNMGVQVRISGNTFYVAKRERQDLKAASADLTNCIDLLPTVAVLAALANGTSQFTGIERARIKESDRIAAVREGLTRLGIEVREERNRLTIVGLKTPAPIQEKKDDKDGKADEKAKTKPKVPEGPVIIDSHNDHRIAMAFSLLGTQLGNVVIDGAECVGKTFPEFWKWFGGVGGNIRQYE